MIKNYLCKRGNIMKKNIITIISLIVVVTVIGLLSVNLFAGSSYVAEVTIFSDNTESLYGSSGIRIDMGKHAWITVRNISSSPITVGGISDVAPGKTVSVGAWGDKVAKEHNGVWYNLEAYKLSKDSAYYNNRVSMATSIGQDKLNSLNSFIKNNDNWSMFAPCSTFAAKAWNTVSGFKFKNPINPGKPSVEELAPNPKALSIMINNMDYPYKGYNARVNYDYAVYYAQGTGAPKISTVFR
jgi:hypothetical protein